MRIILCWYGLLRKKPPRHGLRPRPVSPFQGAFGRFRLPQSRPAGGRGGRKLSGGCNDGCISTFCHDIYCITIRFALSYAARRAALRPALPAERPLKGGDGPAAGWRGGAPPAPTREYHFVPVRIGTRSVLLKCADKLLSHVRGNKPRCGPAQEALPERGRGPSASADGEGVRPRRPRGNITPSRYASARDLPTHGPPWLWARTDAPPQTVRTAQTDAAPGRMFVRFVKSWYGTVSNFRVNLEKKIRYDKLKG